MTIGDVRREVINFDGDTFGTIELCRISKKSAGVSLYLPHRAVQHIRLTDDKSLIAILNDDGSILLLRDEQLVEKLRPVILERRAQAAKLLAKVVR